MNDRLAAGYMNGINDKYAVYYTAKEYSEKQSVEKGTLTGIGVAVVNDTSSGYARIIRLYDNSPAAEAGMQVGGFITAINDESTRNHHLHRAPDLKACWVRRVRPPRSPT